MCVSQLLEMNHEELLTVEEELREQVPCPLKLTVCEIGSNPLSAMVVYTLNNTNHCYGRRINAGPNFWRHWYSFFKDVMGKTFLEHYDGCQKSAFMFLEYKIDKEKHEKQVTEHAERLTEIARFNISDNTLNSTIRKIEKARKHLSKCIWWPIPEIEDGWETFYIHNFINNTNAKEKRPTAQ